MADEIKVLIDVELNESDAQKQVDSLSKSITVLKAETKDLLAVNKTLESEGKVLSTQYVENTKTILANQEQIKSSTAERQNLIKAMGAEQNSIQALKLETQRLTEEKKNLDLSDSTNIKRLGEINDKLRDNKEALNDANEASAKTKTNWQGLTSALDKMVPGLGGAIEGIGGVTKASLAFIATPIGAVIAAIGLALGSLIAYFKSSEEGQDRLNRIMLIGKTVIEQLKNFVEALGEKIYWAVTNPKEALLEFGQLIQTYITNRIQGMLELFPKLGEAIQLLFSGEFKKAGQVALDAVAKATLGINNLTDTIVDFGKSIADAVNEGIKGGNKLADLQAWLDRNERELLVKRAETDKQVAILRDQALDQERTQRKQTIGEAIKLIQDLSDKEVQRFRVLKQQAELELQMNGDDKEAKLKVAKATADLIRAEASRYEEAFKLRKQFEALDAQEIAAEQKKREELSRIKLEAFNKEWEEEVARRQEQNDILDAETMAQFKKEQDAEKKKQALYQQTTNAVINEVGLISKNKDAARIIGNLTSKQDAVKQVFIDTKKGAIAAYSSLATIPIVGPVLGAIAAAAITAFGLAQEAAIAGVTFAEGGNVSRGKMFTLGGRRHSQGGTKFFGEDGTRFEAEADEGLFILKRDAHSSFIRDLSLRNEKYGGRSFGVGQPQFFAQGGEVLTAQADRTISNDRQLRQIADLIYNQPRKVAIIEDIQKLNTQQVQIQENASF